MALPNKIKSVHSVHSKQVVYTSIIEYFGDKRALAAVSLLDEACGRGVFRPIEFVNHLAKVWSLDVDMKTILRKELFRNSMPGVELKKLPMVLEKKLMKPKHTDSNNRVTYLHAAYNSESSEGSGASIVFRLVIHGLLKSAKGRFTDNFRDLVMCFRQELCDVNIPREVRAEFRVWDMTLEIPNQMPDISETEMSSIVQGLYNAMCTALGPVESDAILTNVMNKVSGHDAAADYSPSDFL